MKLRALVLAPVLGASLLAASPALAQAPRSLDGVWRTDGYGQLITIEKGWYRAYSVSSASCTPMGGIKTRRSRDGLTVDISGTLVDLRRVSKNRAAMSADGTVGTRTLVRKERLPRRCLNGRTDPVSVFDAYWQIYRENYSAFGARGVDWKKQRAKYRPMVGRRTSDARLFEILTRMTAPLHDAHTSLTAGKREWGGSRKGTRIPDEPLRARTQAAVDEYLGVKVKAFDPAGFLGHADLPGGITYLRVSSFIFWGGVDDASYEGSRKALDRFLAEVFTPERLASTKGLVLDLRLNYGGYDRLGLDLAARLTDRPYTAFTKRTRNHPVKTGRYTRPQAGEVSVSHLPRYTGPIALLTSDMTVSAGETFTMSMLGRTPAPVRIGAPTQGVFSDVMSAVLPNGWRVGLTNEDYRTPGGRSFEGPGIPVRHRVPVFTESELSSGRDSALAAALKTLKS